MTHLYTTWPLNKTEGQMKKIFLTILIMFVSVSVAFGASTKVSELTETTTLTDDDIFLVSTYLTGNYTSKFIKTSYLKTVLQPYNATLTALAAQTETEGAIQYYTAAATPALLAKGTAYQVLMMNAGATDPAWTSTLGATGTRLTKIWATDMELTNAPTIGGAAWTTILQPLDGELTAIAGLTSAANAIPYFTGSGTAGVISSSANMVSLLGSADYATALGNLGGQPTNPALTSLSSKVFAKTALTGTGGLDTVLYADIADGDIGYVGTIAGIWYIYIFEDSSSAAESSPDVIAPDDAGASDGRWLLKLYCDGSSCSIPRSATGAVSTLLEGSGNGDNFRKTSVPDALTADLNLRHADALPTAGQIQVYPAPTDGVSQYTWTTYGSLMATTFDEVDGHTDSTSLSAANVSRTVVNSYGRAGAATLTLPAAAEGYSAIFIVGTQHNSAWKIQRAGSDTITWSSGGTDTTGKTYFQETNQPVGSRVSCITYRTGSSTYSWLCGSVTGTWVTD
jgi:hypothetical protein